MVTLLIADDEPVVLNLVSDVLQDVGYKILGATDGKTALEIGCDHHITLALLDYLMPGLDGSEVARSLRSRDPNIRIVIMSGYPWDQLAAQAEVPDNISFIQKPFSLDALRTVVKSALGPISPVAG